MVVTHPWQHRAMNRCRELERCGCTKIWLGFGGQAAKPGPSPASVHRRGGQGCAKGWEGRSCTRVSAGALKLAPVCCLPIARLAPSPASLVGKPEICISEYLIWQFCKAECSLRSWLAVTGVLCHKTPATRQPGPEAALRSLCSEESHFASNENFISISFVLFLKQRDISNTQQLEIKKKE